jgi:membrane-bound serine protease (ClpP class)
MDAKAINDAAAYIRSLAELRGRNSEWAEKAVREAASLSASAALKQRVIDIEAKSVGDLLAQLDGRSVIVAGQKVRLATQGLIIQEIRPDWRTELLGAITNPNVALILMMVGVYGLIFEFMNPGFYAPGEFRRRSANPPGDRAADCRNLHRLIRHIGDWRHYRLRAGRYAAF